MTVEELIDKKDLYNVDEGSYYKSRHFNIL